MKTEQIEKKCAICDKTENYIEIYSMSSFVAPNLDLKPNGSQANITMDIQMCPHCGYCNFDISSHIQDRFANPRNNKLELWNNYTKVQEILKGDKSEDVKKCLIMAEQYMGNLDYKDAYNMLIRASWCETDINESKKIKGEALDYYLEKILPSVRDGLLQVADTLRQAEGFETAQNFIDATKCINFENSQGYQYVEKIINYEKNLIENKDSNEHSQNEIK